MNQIRVAVASALAFAAASVAQAGFTVLSVTGSMTSKAGVNLHGTTSIVTDGGPIAATGSVIETGSQAMSRPTFREAALTSGYAVILTSGTTITVNGSTEAMANSGSFDSSANAESQFELRLRIDVDARSMWSLPSGYAASSGGTARYTLRRGNGTVLFDSSVDPWPVAAGILTPGSYELVVECASAASIAGGPDEEGVALSATARSEHWLTLQIVDAPAGGPVADFNGDGFIDFTDFDAFVAAFEDGEFAADVTLDGFLDFNDFDTFVWVFEAGASG